MTPYLNDLYAVFRQRVAARQYDLAELTLRQILDVAGQPPQQYLYLSAEFYEDWGNAEKGSPALAAACYQQALDYRIQIGYLATGSGEGLAAMYHVQRIRKKLNQ